ncbi:Photosystem II PsbR [Artemisia annua]|uniref:Photosystem II 10 kDa polypeptide, chloroplastic n=1 Tax=Artemisia annua TaxID=35608 RepID=A0A2U1LR82_ARTAN|nr:Photosystem II PsbR [Artemisia annua]
MSINDYCTKIKSMADRVQNLGSPVSENNLVTYAVNGLDSRFATILKIIRHCEPLPTFETTRNMLLLEESTFKEAVDNANILGNSSSAPNALLTTKSDTKDNGVKSISKTNHIMNATCHHANHPFMYDCKYYHLTLSYLHQKSNKHRLKKRRMAATVMSSLTLKPSSPFTAVKGLPSLPKKTSFKVSASGGKKIKTDKPYVKILRYRFANPKVQLFLTKFTYLLQGKGVYQFVDKYGANVDGYSPIYNEEEWSPSGDVYVGGTTGLLIWAVTLAGILGGGALLVYSTSALAQ